MTPPGDASSGEDRRAALDAAFARGLASLKLAETIARMLLVDPHGLGGLRLIAPAGPVRTAFLDSIETALNGAPFVRVPLGVGLERLVGGLSVEDSLQRGQLVTVRGLLEQADGGLLVLHMAERLEPADLAPVAAALDTGRILVERPGVSRQGRARFGVIALDEGILDDEAPPTLLGERLAFTLNLRDVPARLAEAIEIDPDDIHRGRMRLAGTQVPEPIIDAIVRACGDTGNASLRAPLFCLRAARAIAALEGRAEATGEDARAACQLVLSAYAASAPETEAEAAPPPPAPQDERTEEAAPLHDAAALDELLIEAVRNGALLGILSDTVSRRARRGGGQAGKSGAEIRGARKGRPDRPRPARLKAGERIDLIATLRAAAPWQKLRARDRGPQDRPLLRRSDLQARRHRHRSDSSIIFLVDASGSAALNRLAEVKGAVELLLGDCYSRRDHVALVAFRGEHSEVLLAPTRSLVRVRRSLSGLPAGGTTPLADGLLAALRLAGLEVARGRTPLVVVLSDGRGNVALDGSTDRARAEADLDLAARRLRAGGHDVLFFDTSRRPSDRARGLSDLLAARYRPLPYAQSGVVAEAVRASLGRGRS